MKLLCLNTCTATMKGKKQIKLDEVVPKGIQRDTKIAAQEITSDFVLEIYERAKKTKSKKKREELLSVAEDLSKHIGKWLVK